MAKQEKSPDELQDDNERTTSMGLYVTAEAYRQSAMLLDDKALWRAPNKIGHAQMPVRFLYSHAIELYLKALLRTRHGIDVIRDKYRHSFRLLLPEAEDIGLVLTCSDRDLFAVMIDTDALIETRYLRTGPKFEGEIVDIEKLRDTCTRVRDSVDDLLRKADLLVQR
jgi:hypothetical protein